MKKTLEYNHDSIRKTLGFKDGTLRAVDVLSYTYQTFKPEKTHPEEVTDARHFKEEGMTEARKALYVVEGKMVYVLASPRKRVLARDTFNIRISGQQENTRTLMRIFEEHVRTNGRNIIEKLENELIIQVRWQKLADMRFI